MVLIWTNSAFATCAISFMVIRNYFATIPKELDEAARIDGESELGIFVKMIVPLSKPIIMVVAIFNASEKYMLAFVFIGNTVWTFFNKSLNKLI